MLTYNLTNHPQPIMHMANSQSLCSRILHILDKIWKAVSQFFQDMCCCYRTRKVMPPNRTIVPVIRNHSKPSVLTQPGITATQIVTQPTNVPLKDDKEKIEMTGAVTNPVQVILVPQLPNVSIQEDKEKENKINKTEQARHPLLVAPRKKIKQSDPKAQKDQKEEVAYKVGHNFGAQFLGDAFISNTFLEKECLEGGSMDNAAKFLREVLKELSSNPEFMDKENDALSAVQGHIDEVIEVYDQFRSIYEKRGIKSSPIFHEGGSRDFSEWIQKKISAMEPGSSMVLPGGWKGSPGHAMLYRIGRQENGDYTMWVFNTGDGTQQHPRKITENKIKNWPCLKQTDIPLKNLLVDEVWKGYYMIRNNSYNTYTSKHVYQGFLGGIHSQFGQDFTEVEIESDAWYTSQRAGKCSVDVWFLLMRSYLNPKQFKRIKLEVIHRAFVKYFEFLEKEEVFCNANDGLPEDLNSESPHKNLAILRFLKTCKEEYCASVAKGMESGILTQASSLEALNFSKKLDALISESSKLYHRFLMMENPFKSIQRDLTGIDGVKRQNLEDDKKGSEIDRKVISYLEMEVEWPQDPVSLKSDLMKWFGMAKERFDKSHIQSVQSFLLSIFKQMPSVMSPYWGKVPSTDREHVMVLLASFSELYARAKPGKADKKEQRLYATTEDICLMQKILAVVKLLSLELPQDTMGVKQCTIAANGLSHSISNDDYGGQRGDMPLTNPVRDQELSEALLFLNRHKGKSATGTFLNNDSEKYKLKFKGFNERMEHTRKEDSFSDEVPFVYHYLKYHKEALEKTKESFGIKAVAKALCDLEGEILPAAFCALKKQALVTKSFLDSGVSVTTCTKLSFQQKVEKEHISISSTYSFENSHHYRFNRKVFFNNKAIDFSFENMYELAYVRQNELILRQDGQYYYGPRLPRDERKDLYLLTSGFDKQHQAIKVISHFIRHPKLLSDSDYQNLFIAVMFERDVLSSQLKDDPDFALVLINFVQNGVDRAKAFGELSTTLFYLRVGHYFQAFCKHLGVSEKITGNFPQLLSELEAMQKDGSAISDNDLSLMYREQLAAISRDDLLSLQNVSQVLRKVFFFTDHFPSNAYSVRLNQDIQQLYRKIRILLQELPETRLGEILASAVLQGVEKCDWDKTNWPQVVSRDKRYAIDLEIGQLYVEGKATTTLPEELAKQAEKCFSLPLREVKSQGLNEYAFVDSTGSLGRAQKKSQDVWILEKEINKSWHVHIQSPFESDPKEFDHPFLNDAKFTFWIDRQNEYEIKVFSNVSGTFEFNYSHVTKRFTSLRQGSCTKGLFAVSHKHQRAAYQFFSHFDTKAILWKDKNGYIKIIESYAQSLYFRVEYTPENQIKSIEVQSPSPFDGYRLMAQQYLPCLERIQGYILLDNAEKERLALIPGRFLINAFSTDRLSEVLAKESQIDPLEALSSLYCYQIDEKGRLSSPELAARLFYSYLLLCQRNYQDAWDLLFFKSGKLDLYSSEEIWILRRIAESKESTRDEDPRAVALRLKAKALIFDNNARYAKEKLHKREGKQFQADLLSYFDQLSHLSSFRLSKDEEVLLINQSDRHSALSHWESILITSKAESGSGYTGGVKEFDEKEIESTVEEIIRHSKCDSEVGKLSWDKLERPSVTNDKDYVEQIFFINNFLLLYHFARDPCAKDNRNFIALMSWATARNHTPSKVIGHVIKNIAESANKPSQKDFDDLINAFQTFKSKVENDEASKKMLEALLSGLLASWNSKSARVPISHAEISKKPKAQIPFVPINRISPATVLPPIISSEQLFGKREVSSSKQMDRKELLEQTSKPIFLAIPLSDKETKAKEELATKSLLQKLEKTRSRQKSRIEERAIRNLITDFQVDIKASDAECWKIDDAQIPKLRNELLRQQEEGKKELQNLRKFLIEEANKPAVGRELIEGLKTRGRRQERKTLNDLILLYLRGNAAQIAMPFYLLVESYLLKATYQQQIMRTIKAINRYEKLGKNSHPSILLNASNDILTTLTAKRAYSPEQYPQFLVFEYKRNLMLRKDQVESMESYIKSGKNLVLHIDMGKGKSEVLAPLKVLENADGKEISILMVLEELMPTVSKNLLLVSGDTFRQVARRINWKNYSRDNLEFIIKELKQISSRGEFLLVTDKDMHDFALHARLNRHGCCERRIETDDVNKVDIQDVFAIVKHQEIQKLYRKIKALLKEKGVVIMDEVDSMLRSQHESHIATGKTTIVNSRYIDIATMAYEFILFDPKVSRVVYFDFSLRFKTIVNQKARLCTYELYCKEIKPLLIEGLFERYMKDASVYHQEVDKYKKEIHTYLLTEATDKSAALPEEMPEKLKNEVAFLRGEIQTFMPMTLNKIYGQNYGFFPPNEHQNTLLAGPFNGADSPSIGSQFAHEAAQMGYTIQAYFRTGISADLLGQVIGNLQNQALRDMNGNGSLKARNTLAYREFSAICGEASKFPFPSLKQKEFEELSKIISKDPRLIFSFVRRYILPTICIYDERITSNAQHLPEMFAKVQGFTGTISSKETFHNSLETISAEGTDANLLKVLWSKRDPVRVLPPAPIVQQGKEKEQMLQLLREILRPIGEKQYSVLIDAGAVFKGDVTQKELAEEVLRLRKDLTAVVYFQKDDAMILKRGNSNPLPYNVSNDVPAEKRFTIFDQKHCRGSNILQEPKAVAVMTLYKNILSDEFKQSLRRMRGYDFDQRVHFIIDRDLQDIIDDERGERGALDSVDLMLFSEKNSAKQRSKENVVAIQQKMQNVVFQACDKVLDTVEVEDLSLAPFKDLDRLLLTILEDAPYKQYGTIPVMREDHVVLEHYRTQSLRKLVVWNSLYKNDPNVTRYGFDLDVEKLSKEIDTIIKGALIPGQEHVEKHLPLEANHLQDASIELTAAARQSVEVNQRVQHKVILENEEGKRDRMLYGSERVSWDKFAGGSSDIPDQFFQREFVSAFNPFELNEKNEKEKLLNSEDVLTLATKKKRYCVSVLDAFKLNPKYNVSVVQKLFHNVKLQLSVNQIFTELLGAALGQHQKPFGSCLIVQDKKEPACVEMIELDGADSEFFKQTLRKDKIKPATGLREVRLALYRPEVGIYQQGSDPIDLESLAKNDEFALLKAQEKVVRGELYDYSEREQGLISGWLSKLAKLDEIENFFRTMLIRRVDSANEYPHSVIATRIFAKLK